MDTLAIIFLFFIIPGTLFYFSVLWLYEWKHFRRFLVLNILLTVGYTLYLIYGDPRFIGHDEYGLQRMAYLIIAPVAHIYINFFIALRIKCKHL